MYITVQLLLLDIFIFCVLKRLLQAVYFVFFSFYNAYLAAVARIRLESWLIICFYCFYWRFALLSVTAKLWLKGLSIQNPDTHSTDRRFSRTTGAAAEEETDLK